MRKLLLSLTLVFMAVSMQAQNEYSTLVMELHGGAKLELSLQKKPQVQVTDKEFVIVCGNDVTSYVHAKVRKFYFKPYDPTGVEEVVAENVIRVSYLDQSKVIISGITDASKVRLYTLDGRYVAASTSADEQTITVSLDALTPGTYILNIDNKQSFKLLKR